MKSPSFALLRETLEDQGIAIEAILQAIQDFHRRDTLVGLWQLRQPLQGISLAGSGAHAV